jgi:hypothetical protein
VALSGNTEGTGNTASGYAALNRNTKGYSNIGLGAGAGSNIVAGINNIEIWATTTSNPAPPPGIGDESNTIRIGTTEPLLPGLAARRFRAPT